MADATVRARVLPEDLNQDIAVLAADLLAESLDAVTVDPGLDLVVSADIVHSEAADADGAAGVAAIEAAITAVGNAVLYGDIDIEADPVLSAPADASIDISDETSVTRTYSLTLSKGAKLVSIEIDTNEIPSGAAVISRGNPQGHESQKSSDGTFDITYGPAVAGDEVGSPHNVTVVVTDSNGRTDSDTVAVTVAA